MICDVETILSNKTIPRHDFLCHGGDFLLRKNTVDSRG